MQNTNLKENITGQSAFQYYRKGELWYQTETGLMFPIPISDTEEGQFNASEKSSMLMRYIRKHIETLKDA